MTPTSLLGSQVRNANRSQVTSPSASLRTLVQPVQIPAKNAKGRLSSNANQAGAFLPSGRVSISLKLVKGTRHRLGCFSQRCQCFEATFRIFVRPESVFRFFNTKAGVGIPQRALTIS